MLAPVVDATDQFVEGSDEAECESDCDDAKRDDQHGSSHARGLVPEKREQRRERKQPHPPGERPQLALATATASEICVDVSHCSHGSRGQVALGPSWSVSWPARRRQS